jgi:transcriptional regulator with XRE-family HTH domain
MGARLRSIREAHELTQAQLAALLGIPHTNVSGIERGVRGLTIQQLVKIARALKVSPAELLDGSGNGSEKTPAGGLPRRFQRIQTLTRPKRRVLYEIIDAFLDRHGRPERS